MDDKSKAALRGMIGEIVEDMQADAVIISVTRRCKRGTETFAIPYGNLHACRGLAEFTYSQLCEDEFDDEEEEKPDDESES